MTNNSPRIRISEIMAEKYGITQKDASEFIKTVFEEIRGLICDGESVQIRGFGTFGTRTMKGRVYALKGTVTTTEDHQKASFKPAFKVSI